MSAYAELAVTTNYSFLRGASDPEELIALRLEKGSLEAYVDPRTIPRDLIDGIRGLMTEDPRERWTLEQFKNWQEGNRVPPPRPYAMIRAHAALDGRQRCRRLVTPDRHLAERAELLPLDRSAVAMRAIFSVLVKSKVLVSRLPSDFSAASGLRIDIAVS